MANPELIDDDRSLDDDGEPWGDPDDDGKDATLDDFED